MSRKITVQEAIEVLKEAGIKISPAQIQYAKKTFEVELKVLQRFVTTVKTKRLMMKDSITEAMSDWLKKHEG